MWRILKFGTPILELQFSHINVPNSTQHFNKVTNCSKTSFWKVFRGFLCVCGFAHQHFLQTTTARIYKQCVSLIQFFLGKTVMRVVLTGLLLAKLCVGCLFVSNSLLFSLRNLTLKLKPTQSPPGSDLYRKTSNFEISKFGSQMSKLIHLHVRF